MTRAILRVACASLLVAGALDAQGDRHEIGLRLRTFERALEAEADPARRDAAFVELERAVQAFFGLDMKRVASSIDAASLALAGRAAAPVEQYARSLQLRLGARLVDAAGGVLTLEVRQLFAVDDQPDPPPELTVAWRTHADGAWARRPLGELPASFEVELGAMPPGDHALRWTLSDGDEVFVDRQLAFGAAADLEARLDAVRAAAATAKGLAPKSIESLTVGALWSLLRTTQRRTPYETELAGCALLAEAERLMAWVADPSGEPLYRSGRPGSFRVRVPVGGRAISCRLFVPDVGGASDVRDASDVGNAPNVAAASRPLVVALHGAGGSENLFFDGYGDGLCVALAKRRGWFVVAPRNGMGFVDCAALVDELAGRYAIDRGKVFMVGHSMGAMQAMSNASRAPRRYAAVAPIAGGGRVAASAALAEVPFFVSAGARDFGKGGAQRLHAALEAAGASARWRLYPSVEHLAVVQVALRDVFAFFDEHAR
ncbi:MAG: dienelactone hydrolase family protein [Planctomycetota bacterium]|nr:dienelactone hydrolase family protein [Planctomycetota bacterium]